jgi:hypothetical protein
LYLGVSRLTFRLALIYRPIANVTSLIEALKLWHHVAMSSVILDTTFSGHKP